MLVQAVLLKYSVVSSTINKQTLKIYMKLYVIMAYYLKNRLRSCTKQNCLKIHIFIVAFCYSTVGAVYLSVLIRPCAQQLVLCIYPYSYVPAHNSRCCVFTRTHTSLHTTVGTVYLSVLIRPCTQHQ